jgi:hypothetical protein
VDGQQIEVIWPGSVPQGLGTGQAMQMMAQKVGPFLRWIPWETDPDWIIRWLKVLADHPDIDIVRTGGWSGYDDMTRYRIKDGRELRSEFIQVGIVDAWAHCPEYQGLQRAFPFLADRPLQIGVKSPFDFALFAFGEGKVLSYTKYVQPFVDATIREMREVSAAATKLGIQVGFQLEFPAELIGSVMLPALMRRTLTKMLVRSLIDVVSHAPIGCLIGGHTCPGRWYNEPKVQPKSTAPLVAIINALVRRWPAAIPPLDYLNLPLGAGRYPPSLDPRFYRPLTKLRVPNTTVLVAGILHERLAMDSTVVLMQLVSDYVRMARGAGGVMPPVALGPTCGSGQLGERDYTHILDTAAALCSAGRAA